MVHPSFISHPDRLEIYKEEEISDDMTDGERISSMVENERRRASQRVVKVYQDPTSKRQAMNELLSGPSHHGQTCRPKG